MKHLTFSLLSVMLAASPILAAPPTTNPTPNPASPPLEVAAAAPAPAEAGTILVFPLTESSGGNMPWVGKAVQQDLVAELSRTTRAHVLTAKAPVADAEAAVQAGRQEGAALAVHGQFQAVGGQMRLTGQVLDVSNGKAVGGFTATGQATDLFPLEDTVTGQVLHALPAAWLTVVLAPEGTNPAGPGNAPPQQTPAPAPANTAQAPAYYSYTYPDNSGAPSVAYQDYSWGYPYYGYPYYGYPYYGGFYLGYGGFWGRGGYGYGHGGYHGYGGYGHSFAGGGHGGGGGGGGHGGGGGGHGR